MESKLLHEQQGQKTYALIFDTGDEAMAGLADFARENKLGASRITAIRGLPRRRARLLRLGVEGIQEDPRARAGRGPVADRRRRDAGWRAEGPRPRGRRPLR